MDDLNRFVLKLLEFVEDSIKEAQSDASSRLGLLSEADSAIAVLKRTLFRDDQKRLAQLMLIGVFDRDLRSLADADDVTLLESVP